MNVSRKILSLLLFLLCIPYIYGQLPPPPKAKPIVNRILFIFDASQSMTGVWEKRTKITVARSILISLIDSLERIDNVELALRVFGHQKPVPPQDCSDSKLEVPFSKGNASIIRQKLRFVDPKGTTPLASSLALSVNDFGNATDCRNIILLITDGIEACDGDPCAVSRDLQSKGISLKPFIIGVGIDDHFKDAFDCIGKYYNAKKEEQFKEVLNVVITQVLNSTTAQVNLLDITGKPTETNVSLCLYDYYSGKIKNSFMHTMNHRGNPDTITLDPLVTYRMIAYTIPPVQKDSFKLTPGKHNIIAVDAPQGYLLVKGDGGQMRNMSVIIRKAGNMNTINYQDLNRAERYLVGKYDMEIPVLPKILLYNVDIKQSTTTTIQIPQATLVTFLTSTPGYGSLFVRERDKDLQWIYNLNTNLRNESMYLQPGNYTIIYRTLNARQSLYSITRTFEITTGGSKVVELY